MRRLKILLYADLHTERLGDSYLRAFRELGHDVRAIDAVGEMRRLSGWLRSRIGHRLTINSLALRRLGSGELNRAFVRSVREHSPDVVFVLSGQFLMPESVRAARTAGARVVIYFPDNPYPPFSASRPESLLTAAECDLYLVWGDLLARQLQSSGVRRARFMPFGWDAECFPFQGLDRPKEHDVVFVGGWDREREAFLDELGRHFKLKIWGPPYWGTRTQRRSAARRAWQGKGLSAAEIAAVSATANINLNVIREQHIVKGQPDGVIMRNFEVPGAGGFLLSSRTGTAERLFPEGMTGAYFQDLAECLTRVDHYLTRVTERTEIQRLAHELVRNRHRYVQRAAEILALLDGSG